MIVELPFPATFDDLMKTDGKADLIGGRIVEYTATGRVPSRTAKRIVLSLDPVVEASGIGEVFTDNMGHATDPPLTSSRQSFSPDVSCYNGLRTNDSSFIHDAPTFAVKVRSEHDYGPAKDAEYGEKRADYFEAGTRVVWDVDPKGQTVTKYEASDPTNGVVFRAGDQADAEPAVPGWRLDVTALFA